jgi:hypothetical protein
MGTLRLPRLLRRWPGIERVKPWLESLQAIATVTAIIVGGLWTYRLFFQQREPFAHANFEEKITRVPVTNGVNLVQVVLKLENTGHTLINVTHAVVRIEQVLPIRGCNSEAPCVAREMNRALAASARVADVFPWPLVANRDAITDQTLEPGEKADFDFEFVVPATVEVARIYGFIQDDRLTSKQNQPVGWYQPVFFDLRGSKSSEAAK